MGRFMCLDASELRGIGLSWGQRKLLASRLKVLIYQLKRRETERAGDTFRGLVQELEQEFENDQQESRQDLASVHELGLDQRMVRYFEEVGIVQVGQVRHWINAGMRPAIKGIGQRYEFAISRSLKRWDDYCTAIQNRVNRRNRYRRRLDS